MTSRYAFDAANPAISISAMRQHGGIVAPVYIVGTPGGMAHADKARVAALRAAGLAPLPNWERAANFFAHDTPAQAEAAGVEALAACRHLGFPDDGSIDVAFSFDYDLEPPNYPAAAADLAAVNKGLGGHYRAIAYGPIGFINYLAAHRQPGPHWLMASTFRASSQFTAAEVNSPHVAMVQSHDAAGNWLDSPVGGTDINTVTHPESLGAWWPDDSPYAQEAHTLSDLTKDQLTQIAEAVRDELLNYPVPSPTNGTKYPLLSYLVNADVYANQALAKIGSVATAVNTLAPRVAQLQAAVDALSKAAAPAQQVVLDTAAVAKAAADAVVAELRGLVWGVK